MFFKRFSILLLLFSVEFEGFIEMRIIIKSSLMNMKNEFADISYFLLFKLLCVETVETQNEITNLLGGEDNEDPSFLEEFSQILFYRIILLIIVNVPNRLLLWE